MADESQMEGVPSLIDRLTVLIELFDRRFDEIAEVMRAMQERMDRRFDQLEANRQADMKLFRDVMGNHEGRIRRPEDTSGLPA